jgi:hypothetical protein
MTLQSVWKPEISSYRRFVLTVGSFTKRGVVWTLRRRNESGVGVPLFNFLSKVGCMVTCLTCDGPHWTAVVSRCMDIIMMLLTEVVSVRVQALACTVTLNLISKRIDFLFLLAVLFPRTSRVRSHAECLVRKLLFASMSCEINVKDDSSQPNPQHL